MTWLSVDGSRTREHIEVSDGGGWPTSFLPDETGVLIFGERGEANDDIAFVPLDGEGEVKVLIGTSANERLPEVSPDGRWLAYVSDQSGINEVYVRPYPDVDAGRWQVSTDGGTEPLWSRDGEELFFRKNGAIWGVRIDSGSGFSHGNPELIFAGPYPEEIQGGRAYDISPDGERFLMLATATDPSATPRIVIIQNWVEELKRIVPVE